jgi:hypothetical protein
VNSRCCACWWAGTPNRQIAAELFIAHSPVHTPTVHIYAKCAVSNARTERQGPQQPAGRIIWHELGIDNLVAGERDRASIDLGEDRI